MTSTPQRPGGRSARVREAVLAATAAELSERGFAAMTIEDIAARSGVHKTTIYRRWSTLSQLVADAAVEISATTVPIPDTGSIESDLREMARSIVALVTSESGGALVAALFSDAVRTPEVARLKREFYSARYELADIVVRRAVERGEISEKISAADLLAAVAAPIYYRLLVADLPVDRSVADRAAAGALAAAHAGALDQTE
ncbi:TetR/AcrR family transcriptional regulator [Rhodococcus erythropolis]|uniref:TetR/AcrR family transcriptional regulator n=1 Tax=Rhodococcus erythropolis TaxID=1833 RepID=UPI001E43F5E4|nr:MULTISPECIES: TetR/AcrR family transcriptional regulator [Rhodococcus erythropolis group]MCD2107222.1 TetR/AcrR family transcriptional regulator [Rhodococcus qingshengii]MCZ4526652.1 TetR/AcrR family transcriptional regulator [Rhodococcus erythropolis]